MMAVVLALGLLVLQGCVTTNNQMSDAFICAMAVNQDNKWSNYKGVQKYVSLAKKKKLDCGVKDNNKTIIASKPETKTYIQSKPSISSAELNAERQKRIELERKLLALQSKQKQEQQRINSDNERPIINAFSKPNGSNAIISGRVTDNT